MKILASTLGTIALLTTAVSTTLAALPDPGMRIEKGHTALVVTDPQNDFLSPKGVTWGVVGKNVEANNTVEGTDVATSFKEKQQVPHRTISVNNRPPLILHLNRTCEERLHGYRGTVRMHWSNGATGNVKPLAGSLSPDSFQRQRVHDARNTGTIRPNNREDCPLILREFRELLQSRLSFC